MPTIALRSLNLNPTCRIILAVSIRNGEGYQRPKHGEDNFLLPRFFPGDNLLDVTTLKSRNRVCSKPSEKPLGDISPRPLGIGGQLSKCCRVQIFAGQPIEGSMLACKPLN